MKKWFVSFRYPVPTDMEDYLEQIAREGYGLTYVKQGGLFTYDFDKKLGGKCCYMVDAIPLNQGDYVKHIVDDGWEYLGKSGNLVIARKYYNEKRPEKPVNEIFRIKHCRNIGLAYLVIGIIFTALIILAALTIHRMFPWNPENKVFSLILSILEIVLQLPLGILAFRNAGKCLGYHPVIRQVRRREQVEEKTSLEFLGEEEPKEEVSKPKEPENYVSIFDREPELDFLKENK